MNGPLSFDVLDVVLLVAIAVAIVVAVLVPDWRKVAAGIGLVLAGLAGGKRLFGEKDDQVDIDEKPPSRLGEDTDTPIDNPNRRTDEEVRDAEADVDSLSDDDLDRELERLGERARDELGSRTNE